MENNITNMARFMFEKLDELPENKDVQKHLTGFFKNKKQYRAEAWSKGKCLRWISLDLFYENKERAFKYLFYGGY